MINRHNIVRFSVRMLNLLALGLSLKYGADHLVIALFAVNLTGFLAGASS